MKIMVHVSGSYLLLEPSETVGPLLEALSHAVICTYNYENNKKRYKITGTEGSPDRPTLEFVDEADLQPALPVVDDLTRALKSSSDRWLQEYNKRVALEKELDDLKAKVAGLTTPKE